MNMNETKWIRIRWDPIRGNYSNMWFSMWFGTAVYPTGLTKGWNQIAKISKFFSYTDAVQMDVSTHES